MLQNALFVLVGPTAVGKTSLSIRIAKAINGEIISGDSMQVYRGFDIGTAKIMEQEKGGIPHHLIDIKDSDASFSVAEFHDIVTAKIEEIQKRGKVPMIVGGTGLYVNSIIYDYNFGNAINDDKYRNQLLEQVNREGNEKVYQLLKEIDPKSAERIHLNDTKRIVRALEVYHVTGKPMSAYEGSIDKNKMKYPLAYVGLAMDREKLYERINHRVDMMISDGWLEEIQQLLDKGVSPDCMAFQGLGYRQLIMYKRGEISLERAIELIKRDTRHFAKRQLTWFRHDPNINWVNVEGKSENDCLQEIMEIISRTIGK